MVRKKTVVLNIGIICVFLYWYFYMYLNDLPEGQKARLTPHLYHVYHVKPTTYTNTLNFGSRNNVVDLRLSSRLREYCNPPTKTDGQEGEVRSEFELRSVIVAIRHGDRSPMHSIKNHPNTKLSCKFDEELFLKYEIINGYINTLTVNAKKFPHDSYFRKWELFPNKKFCDGAELTPFGALQHLKNGEFLKKKYFSKLFKKNFSYSDIHIRSTEYTRTFQSAVAFLFGFLPEFNLEKIQIQHSADVHFCSSGRTGQTCRCLLAYVLKQRAETQAGSFSHNNSNHKELIQKVANIYTIQPKQVPWLASLLDIFMPHVCHQIALPCNGKDLCVNQPFLEKIWNIVDSDGVQFKLQNKHFMMYSHLAMHPLLNEVLNRMRDRVLSKNTPKFVLYSGHDITLSPLAAVLGIYDGKWPPFASRIIFELYTKVGSKKVHADYIRVLYNGKDRTRDLSFCKKFHHGLCRLHHFEHFVENHLKSYNITNFNLQCNNYVMM